MPRCPICKTQWRTLEDEQFMHGCPRCGYGPDWDEKEEEGDEDGEHNV